MLQIYQTPLKSAPFRKDYCGTNDELWPSPKYDSLEKLIIKGIEINSIGEVI